MAQLPKDKHITYQLQYRKCGKPNCSTCRDGQGHGPYWYAYWHEGSRLRSTYIGKTLVREDASEVPSTAPHQTNHNASQPARQGEDKPSPYAAATWLASPVHHRGDPGGF